MTNSLREGYTAICKYKEIITMSMLRRSRRRGMVIGAAAASRANKRTAAQPAPAAAAPAPSAPSTDDAIEQVKKLAELRDQGILTEAEFDAKKKQLLGI